jgi:phenylalanyl-tRNA synthetase beta chain
MGPDAIADKLTEIGLEVDEVIAPVVPVVAKIVECKPHPNSDHLHVLRVDDGSDHLCQVVCGAPNARVGLISALAKPGCKIGGTDIKSGRIRGELSDGMMCSGKEMDINDDHSGILELPENSTIGAPVKAAGAVVVFEAGITPNRPDYLGVRGIARDLAAAGAGKMKAADQFDDIKESGTRKVHIQDLVACPVYRLMEIHNLKMAPSDETVALRLSAIGVNPKNAPIDATNYLCYDINQPMHCFDADDIVGDITVRKAHASERFTDLFGTEHALTPDDLVIADERGILALAGVIGGARGMTTDRTKNIILESAYFEPVGVRMTSRRAGVSTDSSYRYERGIDPTTTGDAIRRAAREIMARCGGKIAGYRVARQNPAERRKIKYAPALFKQKTGIDLDAKKQKEILENLGYSVDARGADWTVIPTPARGDVDIPESIVSELMRLYGYENIAMTPVKNVAGAGRMNQDNGELDIKRKLCAAGLTESVSFGFSDSKIQSLIIENAQVPVANPILDTLDVMRGSLVPNMLAAVSENEKRGYPNMALFELGTVFDGGAPGDEHKQLVIARTGDASPKHWLKRNRPYDVYDVKSDVLGVLGNIDFSTDTSRPPKWAHPFRYGRLMLGRTAVAEFGELHPSIAKKLKIKTNVVIGMIGDIKNIPVKKYRAVKAFSDFQPITRDFAFLVENNFPAEKIVNAAKSADGRIKSVIVFDAFEKADKKSIAFTMTIQPEGNMSDTDLTAIQNAVIAAVEKNCPAKIRDGAN